MNATDRSPVFISVCRRPTLNTVILLPAACFLLVFCGVYFWRLKPHAPVLRVKTVRHTVEKGRQVVFFRVVGAVSRRIEIADVKLLEDTYNDGRFETPALSYLVPLGEETAFHTFDTQNKGVPFHEVDFWASSELLLLDPAKARREFGLFAPTNGISWKVRVTVNVETAELGGRLAKLVHDWRFYRGTGCSARKAAQSAWGSFYQFETKVIESNLML